MALSGLDLRQPDLGALNYVAGRSSQLNLPNAGALGLQAMQTEFNQENQQRQQALQQMQLQQQGQLGLGQQNLQQQQLQQQAANQQRQGLLQQQQMANQQQQQGFQNQMAQQQQARQDAQQQAAQQQQGFQNQLAQQQLDQQNAQQHFQQVAAMSKTDLQQKGAFASYALMSLQGAKSPQEAQQIGQAVYKEAVDKNYLSSDQAAQLSQLPLSQQQNAMKAMIISMGQTKAYKDMQDDNSSSSDNKSAKGAPVTDPTTGAVSVPLTATEQTNLQKQITVQDKMLNQLTELKQTFKPDYFTYGGKATKGIAEVENKLQGSPLQAPLSAVANVLTGETQPQRDQFLNDAAQYNHSAGQIFQQYIQSIAGSRPSAERVKQLQTLFANESMSPTEYNAGLTQLMRDIQNERDQSANMLNKGMSTTPPADPNAGRRGYLSSLKNSDGTPRYTSDQIENFLKSYKQ